MTRPNVIVIAGTADARQIIAGLEKLDIEITATVATGYGSELLGGNENVTVCEGRMDSEEMTSFICKTGARCLVDASHPYAREVSLNAISACAQANIPYLRYERNETGTAGRNVLEAGSFEEAADLAAGLEGNIFLATGSNNLEVFVKRIPGYKERLFVRVLPDSRVIARCEQAGLSAGNIIAMKGPFSEGMNIEVLKHCNAAVMVTKDSGDAGGTGDKLAAAGKLGITVIMVQRPEMAYPHKVNSLEEVICFVKENVRV